MKRTVSSFAIVALAALLLAATATPGRAQEGCCIAGLYQVAVQDIPKGNCGNGSDVVLFRLGQQPGCGPKLEGKAQRQSDKALMGFSGNIVQITDKCCTVDGVFQLQGGAQIQLRCHFCWRNGVFSVKGKATLGNGCVQVWEMTRIEEPRRELVEKR